MMTNYELQRLAHTEKRASEGLQRLSEKSGKAWLAAGLKAIHKHFDDLTKTARQCEEAGMVDAGEHLKAGKYLHLVYRRDAVATGEWEEHANNANGVRVRPYIGCDPGKMEAARKAIARFEIWKETKNEIDNIERRIDRIENLVGHLSSELDLRKPPSLWD